MILREIFTNITTIVVSFPCILNIEYSYLIPHRYQVIFIFRLLHINIDSTVTKHTNKDLWNIQCDIYVKIAMQVA